MNSLCDTNILSELARKEPDPGVLAWASGQMRLRLSVITIEEVIYGLSWQPNARVKDWFERFEEEYCDVLPVIEPISRHAGELRGALRRAGRTRSQADLPIAATAALHGLTLVSRNEKDFSGCGISVLNPFL